MAQSQGAETGGLIIGTSPGPGWSQLDHDQRNTLNVGFNATLPWQSFVSSNVYYGSGFSNGSEGIPGAPYINDAYLPGHTQVDVSVGKEIGERLSVSVSALNIANSHLLIDNSLTFGGFHYDNPRQVYVQVRYKFHY